MPISLKTPALEQTLEEAFLLASSSDTLPDKWVKRMETLNKSPSRAFIAGVGSVLLAKATDPKIDAFVLKARAGGAGAFSLRSAATVLAGKKRAYGYDIASTSDHDPINHSTLNGFVRWDAALSRIRKDHQPFYQVILQWLGDINNISQGEALEALAAYIRARSNISAASIVQQVPQSLTQVPSLTSLADTLEAFVSADAESGARGMALVAAVYRAAGFDADVPGPNDPRRIDIPIKRDKQLVIGTEVKQIPTKEGVADTLATDVVSAGARRGLLAVLPPGYLDSFDRKSVIFRTEAQSGVILRVTEGVRELMHEAICSSTVPVDDFCTQLPRRFAEALDEINVEKSTIKTWAAIAQQWGPSSS